MARSVYGVVLICCLLALFADMARHVFLGWKVYFRWQLSLDRRDRAPIRIGAPRGGVSWLDGMVDAPVEDAPVDVARVYRLHARWFLREAALAFAVGGLGVILANVIW